MVKLMGAVLVAAGCGWLGFQGAEGLRRRVRALRDMAGGLLLLERELELGAPPLPGLMDGLSARACGPAKALFEGCRVGLERLSEEPFALLWRRLIQEQSALGEEGRGALLPLGEVLGRYDSQAQLESVSAARRQLEELAARCEAEGRRQGRVYQALGLCSGVFLVILLL